MLFSGDDFNNIYPIKHTSLTQYSNFLKNESMMIANLNFDKQLFFFDFLFQ